MRTEVPTIPHQISTYEVNQALRAAPTQKVLQGLILEHLEKMDAINLATSFYRLAKLTRRDKLNVRALKQETATIKLVARIRSEIQSFDAAGLGILSWAQSKCPLGDSGDFVLFRNTFESLLASDPDKVSDRTLGCVLSACGKTSTGKSFLKRNSKILLDRIADCVPVYLVNLMWVCAKLDHKDDALVSECMNGILYRTHELTLSGKKNLAWSFAKLNIFEPAFLIHLVKESITEIDNMGPFDILTFAWGFITQTLQLESSRSEADKFTENKAPASHECSTWEKSSEVTVFYEALCKRTHELMGQDTRHAWFPMIKQMIWFLAVVDWKDDALLEALCRGVLSKSPNMSIEDISLIMWSLARIGYEDKKLMDMMCQKGQTKLDERGPKFSSQVSMCLYSLACFNNTKTEYFKAFIENLQMVALELIPSSSSQFLANVAWSVATIGSCNRDLLRGLREQAHERMINSKTEDFTDLQLAMLHQASLCLQNESPELSIHFPPSFSSNERLEIWYGMDKRTLQGHEQRLSKLQNEVLEALRSMGWRPVLGHKDGYCIDIALPDLEVAIEIEGPSRFSCNMLEPLGLCNVKYKALHSRGWKVVAIPFFQWTFFLTRAARRDYLTQAIEATLKMSAEEPNRYRDTSTMLVPTDVLGQEIDAVASNGNGWSNAKLLASQSSSNGTELGGKPVQGVCLGSEAREAILQALIPVPPTV